MCIGSGAHGQDMAVSVPKQLDFFLKVLTFDRLLPRHDGDNINIAVLFQDDFARSLETRNEFARACKAYTNLQIAGIPLRVVYISWQGLEKLAAVLEDQEIGALYVAPLKGVPIEKVRNLCRHHQVTTLTGVPEYVQAGLAVGIGLAHESPKILINLAAARAEGADFSSQLLKLATAMPQHGLLTSDRIDERSRQAMVHSD